MKSDLISKKIEFLRSMAGIKSTRPDMRIDVVVQEAINLYECCKSDREKLERAGLDWSYAEDLPVRANALLELHSVWNVEKNTPDPTREEWKEALMQARELRKELLHIYRFVFKDLQDAVKKVKELSGAPNYAEFIQSISNLAQFGLNHRELLESRGVGTTLLDKARIMGTNLPGIYSRAKPDIKEGREGTELRNKAFYHLREAVDKVRKAGRYVFDESQDEYKGYVSDFIRKKKQIKKRKNKRRSKPRKS